MINHKEAFELACYTKEHSNLARAYLELRDILKGLHDNSYFGDPDKYDNAMDEAAKILLGDDK
jgi:hypothetical protein